MSTPKMTLIDQIRNRPGMYIGDLYAHGLKSMLGLFLEEVFQVHPNPIEINIDIKSDQVLALKIHAIDTDLFQKTLENLNDENKPVSLGLSILIALSEHAAIKFSHKGTLYTLNSRNGNYAYHKTSFAEKNDFIDLEYKIPSTIFKEHELNYETFNELFRKYAYIHSHCRIISHNSSTVIRQTILFDYPRGLSHLLDLKISDQYYRHPIFRLDLNTIIDGYEYQVCISYMKYGLEKSYLMTYANVDELTEGGSLEDGIIDGLFMGLKHFADQKNIAIDKRKMKKSLILLAVIKGNNLRFAGSLKTKLNMPKVRKNIKAFVSQKTLDYLAQHKPIDEEILNKLEMIDFPNHNN